MMIIDTHCHLGMITQNENELKTILMQCKNNNVSFIINISVDYPSNFNNQLLAKKHSELYYTIGIHPHEVHSINDEQLLSIKKMIEDDKCVGVGEIGIDLYRGKENKKDQIELFVKFLEIAKQYNKIIIIHSREAFSSVYDIIKQKDFQNIKGVFHCFSYGYEEAKKCIDLGYKVSFAGNLTYKNAKQIQEAAIKIPLEEILLETDAPFLSPQPKRGEKNYPYNIIYTAEFLSRLRQQDQTKLLDTIYTNSRNFFRI